MRLLSLIFLLMMAGTFADVGFEDAKKIMSAVKSVAEISRSENSKKVSLFINAAAKFVKLTVPYGELFATALKITLEEDKIQSLLVLARGISKELISAGKTLEFLAEGMKKNELYIFYKKKVQYPLNGMMERINSMIEMTPDADDREVFNKLCDTRYRDIILSLKSMADKCIHSTLSHEARLLLEGSIDRSTLHTNLLTDEEQIVYNTNFAILQVKLSSEKSMHKHRKTIRHFHKRHRAKKFFNKLSLLSKLMKEFQVSEKEEDYEFCLPLTHFIAKGYQRKVLESYVDTFVDHLLTMNLITRFCAHSLNPDEAAANSWFHNRDASLASVRTLLEKWFPTMLESTWPQQEAAMIKEIIEKQTNDSTISETKAAYDGVANAISKAMAKVGSDLYVREYIVSRKRSILAANREFHHECVKSTCHRVTTKGVQVIILRTTVDNSSLPVSMERLDRFSDWVQPKLQTLFEQKYFNRKEPQLVLHDLDREDNINMKSFKNTTNVLAFRDTGVLSCDTVLSVKSDMELKRSIVRNFTYSTGSYLCDSWVLLYGV